MLQGFPALRKAVTTQKKNHINFYEVFDIANQLLTHRMPFVPLCHVDGKLAFTMLKHWKIYYRQWRSRFPWRGRKPKYKKEKLWWLMVFLKAESENWQNWQAEFSCVCEKISSVNKEEISNWEFCWLKVTPIVCFFNAFFHPWPNQEMHYVTLSRGGTHF